MASAPHVAVLGGGAVGCLWAARLAHADVATSLLLRRPPQGQNEIISIENAWQDSAPNCTEHVSVRVQAADSPGEPLSCILLATKAYSAIQDLRNISSRLLPGAVCVVLCNGALAIEEEIAMEPALHGLTVILGTTTHSSWRRAPFQVVHAGFGYTRFGLAKQCVQKGSDSPLSVPTVLELLQRSGLYDGTGSYMDIEPCLWRKLAVNAAVNPLTALWDCRNGEVLASPHGRAILWMVASEVAALAVAMGVADRAGVDMCTQQLDAKGLYGIIEQAVRASTASYSSMHQDMSAHRQTEIGYLNAWVAKRAADLGVPVPTNSQLADAIIAKEHNFPK